MDNPLSSNRALVNVFIVVCITLAAIDGLPSFGPLHRQLKRYIDPVLDKTGTWQESWKLFAPEPDTINVRVSGVVYFSDDTYRVWESPEWSQIGIIDRFLQFRHMEYIDGVRLDRNSAAWSGFADYLARTLRPANNGATVERVDLIRSWGAIPAPDERWVPARPYPAHEEAYVFFSERYHRAD